MAPPAKSRPYRRILTSTLHRRFVHASALSLLACYVVSFFIGVKTSAFWSWFPLGICGFRALLLSVSSLVIFVLRVGGMHVGSQTPSTRFQGWVRAAFSLSTLQVFGWYIFSAWWFSEVYIWSASEDASLNWVIPGRSFERARINERPIYLHCYYLLLAIGQSILHIHYDWDQVPIPVAKPSPQTTDRRTHASEPVTDRIKRGLPEVVYEAALRSGVTTVVAPFIYKFLLRRRAWDWTLFFAKLFWDFPRSAAEPPGVIPPLHVYLLLRALFSGILLISLWQTSNLFFSTFLGQEPLKQKHPLTQGAKDPNGSLINGLKANKEVVKTYALWELSLISQEFPDRRKEIFNDIDREGGPAWSQLLNVSLDVIKHISSRIEEFKNPNPRPSVPSQPQPSAATEGKGTAGKPADEKPTLDALPRLSPAPKREDIFLASPKPSTGSEKFEAAVGAVAKSYGQSPDWTPSAQTRARNFIDRASSAVLTPSSKQRLSTSAEEVRLLSADGSGGTDAKSQAESRPSHWILEQFIRSTVGIPFRQSYARRLRRIVLGTPYSHLPSIVDATVSVTRFLVASLTEDQFGKVHADVADIVKLFTQTITTIEAFLAEDGGGLPLHWTDVDFPPPSSSDAEARRAARKVEEVEIVLATMKAGLAELLAAFRPYLNEVGVKGKDLRMAREAVGSVEDDGAVS